MGGWQSTPVEGNIEVKSPEATREEARQLYEQSRELSQQSQQARLLHGASYLLCQPMQPAQAWHGGDRQQANVMSDRAKEIRRLAHDANSRAAREIFRHNNEGRPDSHVDLHGLHVKEAEAEADRALQQAKAMGAQSVVFIVGRGLHSRDGVSKLRPAIERLIERHSLRCSPDVPNVGCVRAEFVKPEERGWFGFLAKGCIVM